MLNEQAQKMMDAAKGAGIPPVYSLTVPEARERMRKAFIRTDGVQEVTSVREEDISLSDHPIRVRIYAPNPGNNLPCILFFHGGGWTLNDLDTHDDLCRSICSDVEAVVISVDFRLAPEHKFPAAIDDSYAALEWVFENHGRLGIDTDRIAVAGDSSGATQATVVCRLARDRGLPAIRYQWLLYPVTDFYDRNTVSYEENATGYSLDREMMVWFWGNYIDDTTDRNDSRLCPLRCDDLAGMPPGLVMTAHYDPLRDEGETYAKKLIEAGVDIELIRYGDQMHGFILQRRKIDTADIAYRDAVSRLRKALSVSNG
jgi:acetyl esterase